MDYKIYFRRVVALLLCCLLALYSPLLPIAHASDPVTAATLAVSGGQIAAGGLTGEAAITALGGPVGAIVGITLGALGIGTYITKASADAGVTPSEFVVTNIAKYCVLADIKKEQFMKTVMGGVSVAADGAIALSNSAAQAIQQFGSWLVTQDSDTIVPPPSGEVSGPGSATSSLPAAQSANVSQPYYWISGSFSCRVNNTEYAFSGSSDVYYFILLRGSRVAITAFSPVRNTCFSLTRTNSSGSSTTSYSISDTNTYYNKTCYINSFMSWVSYSPSSGDYVPFYSSIINTSQTHTAFPEWACLYGDVVMPGTDAPTQDVFTGTPEAWAEHKDLLNPSADEDTPAAVLNPDVLNPIIEQLAEGTQWQMGITDYLKALEAAFDQAITGLGDKVVSLTDVVTGIKKDIAVPDDATKTADLTKPEVAPITTPVVQPLEVNPDEAIDGISFQLDEVFPFCLPFDVYKMLGLLSADPVAPRYHVHYEGPYNILIDFTVDLSAWDDVAAICRNMELLLFCVGLAVATRSIFIRA